MDSSPLVSYVCHYFLVAALPAQANASVPLILQADRRVGVFLRLFSPPCFDTVPPHRSGSTIIPILAQRLLLNMRKVAYVGSQPVASKLLFAALEQGVGGEFGSSEVDDGSAREGLGDVEA